MARGKAAPKKATAPAKTPMKKSTGAKAKAKAGAGTSRAPRRQSQSPAPPGKNDCQGAADAADDTPAKRRRLERRDTEQAAKRAIEDKLGHIDPLVLRTRVDAEGRTIESRVIDEIHRLQKRKVAVFYSCLSVGSKGWVGGLSRGLREHDFDGVPV